MHDMSVVVVVVSGFLSQIPNFQCAGENNCV